MKKYFTNKQKRCMRKYARRIRVTPSMIKAVVLARGISIPKAAEILEKLLNQGRESRFDF